MSASNTTENDVLKMICGLRLDLDTTGGCGSRRE